MALDRMGYNSLLAKVIGGCVDKAAHRTQGTMT